MAQQIVFDWLDLVSTQYFSYLSCDSVLSNISVCSHTFHSYLSYVLLCLIILGAAEEAIVVFGEAATLCIQKQYLHHGLASPSLHMSSEDYNLVSSRNFGSEDVSPRQLKHTQGNSLRDIPGNHHGAAVLSGVLSQPQNGGPSNMSFYNTPSPMASQVR